MEFSSFSVVGDCFSSCWWFFVVFILAFSWFVFSIMILILFFGGFVNSRFVVFRGFSWNFVDLPTVAVMAL